MTDYKLVLKASLDEKSLTTEIDRINKEGKYSIALKISPEGMKDLQNQINTMQKQTTGGGKGLQIVDLKRELMSIDEVRKKIQQITTSIDQEAKFEYFSKMEEGVEKVNKAVITYSDGIGKTVKETYNAVHATDAQGKATEQVLGYQKEVVRYTEDAAKATRVATAEEEKRKKELERSVQFAKEFLAKSEKLAPSDTVTKGRGQASQILELAKGGTAALDAIRPLNAELKITSAVTGQAGHAAWSFSEQLSVAISRTVQWATSMGLVYGVMNQLKQGVQYIKDLDKEMTNIQIATGLSQEATNGLAVTYNQLATELGATTLQVAESATTWLKQGKSVEESQELIKGTMMISKMAMIDSASAAEYLTSILNGYQMEVSDTMGILDKLISVDNAAATSVGELATALQRSANVARTSGVDFEHLVAFVGTVSSVTRRSAETVGEAFFGGFIVYNINYKEKFPLIIRTPFREGNEMEEIYV